MMSKSFVFLTFVCFAESFVRNVISSPNLNFALNGRVSSIDILKENLYSTLARCQPNGLDVSSSMRTEIDNLVQKIELLNPTKNAAKSTKMNGFWRMLYTDLTPAAASNGKLGPFVGDVFQDLDSNNLQIKNLLKIKFPPIQGALVASLVIPNNNSWRITFEKISNSIFGFKLPEKEFPKGEQVRIWKITYLDDDLRVMRAGRPENMESEYFLFILRRDEENRF